MDNPLQQAIAAIKARDKSTGKRLLAQMLQTDPRDERRHLEITVGADAEQEGFNQRCLEGI